VPLLMLVAALWAPTVPRDFSIAAGMLAVIVVIEMLRTRAVGSLLVRTAIYGAAIFSAYLLMSDASAAMPVVRYALLATIGVLAVAVAVYIRLSSSREFGTTPTDYLVVFGLLALFVFGSIDRGSQAVVELVACATVLMYGCEVLLGRSVQGWEPLHGATVVALAIMAARGLPI